MNKPNSHRTYRWHSPAAFIFAALFVSTAMIVATHAAGDLDRTFGNGGKVVTDFSIADSISDMAVQADGKIVVVGHAGDPPVFALARYNTNGSLDSSFGNGGKVTTDFSGGDDLAFGVAIQSDGKIVVVGQIFPVDFAIARYNENGTLDPTFGIGGKVMTDFGGTNDFSNTVVIQPDNKIVVGGYIQAPSNGEFGLARYNGDGSLDTSFDTDGKVTTDIIFGNDVVHSLALYADGRIVAAGESGEDFGLARYNSNGSLDPTFDTDGMLRVDFGINLRTQLTAIAIQPDNKIVAVGYARISQLPDHAFGLMRYNVDGSLDSTFDGDGKILTSFFSDNGSEFASDVAITTGGKILVAGYTLAGDFTFSRYLIDGSLDYNFGDRGRLFSHLLLSGSTTATAVAIQTDGKILAAGYGRTSPINGSGDDFYVARYEANPRSIPVRSDFDLDARSDIAVFRPSDGIWYVLNSSDGTVHAQPFGTSGDIAVPGDYDGDGGGTDFAVFRPSSNTWYILHSSDSSFRAEIFGATGDVPVPADYDGDGKTDVAVYRPSEGTWYVLKSSDNSLRAETFGISTDRPVPGYYDGDGKADIAVFRESTGTWYILESSTNAFRAQPWGTIGDQPVASDYDGDGLFDIAVFRPSNGLWYIQRTFDGVLTGRELGVSGDRPVPADYTGDFKTEIAVWRPSDGIWYISDSHYIGYQSIPFGTSGDTPVAAAYLP